MSCTLFYICISTEIIFCSYECGLLLVQVIDYSNILPKYVKVTKQFKLIFMAYVIEYLCVSLIVIGVLIVSLLFLVSFVFFFDLHAISGCFFCFWSRLLNRLRNSSSVAVLFKLGSSNSANKRIMCAVLFAMIAATCSSIYLYQSNFYTVLDTNIRF